MKKKIQSVEKAELRRKNVNHKSKQFEVCENCTSTTKDPQTHNLVDVGLTLKNKRFFSVERRRHLKRNLNSIKFALMPAIKKHDVLLVFG